MKSVKPRTGHQSINEMATVIQRAWRLFKIRKDEKEKKEKFSTMKKLSTLPILPSETVTRRSRSFGLFNYFYLKIFWTIKNQFIGKRSKIDDLKS